MKESRMKAIILILTDHVEQHPLRMQEILTPDPPVPPDGLHPRLGVTPDDAKEVIVAQTALIEIKRPRTDDRRVWDVVFGVYGFPAILLAHKLKLFPLLAKSTAVTSSRSVSHLRHAIDFPA
jgi:hypothetical protein